MSLPIHFCQKKALYVTGLFILACCSTTQAVELFVADRATNRILSFDESTGQFLRVVTATGLDGPSGITFGPGGFLYVSNVQGGQGLDSAASVVRVDRVIGTTTPFITDVLGPGGIAYHADSDTLFVSELASEFDDFGGDEVFRYNANSTLLQILGTGSPATGRAGATFDGAGNLYVSEFNLTGVGSVLKYDAPLGNPGDDYSSTATTFASGADVTLLFPAPAGGFNGLAFDGAGDLLVASLIGQSIIKFSVVDGAVTGGAPFGMPLPYPADVKVDGDSNLLVASLGNNNPADPIYGDNLFPGSISRYNRVTAGTTPFLVGDTNRDALVNGGDLAVFQISFGTDGGGDLDGDLDTDGADFLTWQRANGNEGLDDVGLAGGFQPTGMVRYEPILEVISVPEPASIGLGLWVLVAGAWVLRTGVGC